MYIASSKHNSREFWPPLPQLIDLMYTLISTTSSHPSAFCKSRHVQVGFDIGMIEDPVSDPICSVIFFFFVFGIFVSFFFLCVCLLDSSFLLIIIHKLTGWELDHDCSACQLGSSPRGKTV